MAFIRKIGDYSIELNLEQEEICVLEAGNVSHLQMFRLVINNSPKKH